MTRVVSYAIAAVLSTCMALPNSRDYDAVDAGPLPHTVVNNLQDAVVDHESRIAAAETSVADHETRLDSLDAEKHGDRTISISAAEASFETVLWKTPTSPDSDSDFPAYISGDGLGGTEPASSWRSTAARSIDIDFPIRLRAGDRIKSIVIHGHEGNAAGETLETRVYERHFNATTNTQHSSTKSGGTSGGFVTITHTSPDSGFPLTVVAGRAYHVRVLLQAADAANEVYCTGIVVTYDRP